MLHTFIIIILEYNMIHLNTMYEYKIVSSILIKLLLFKKVIILVLLFFIVRIIFVF
jgi:hypothetical protein